MGLPAGSVTLLFTDIEGSTQLLQAVGDEYASLVATHRSLLRQAVGSRGGHEVDTQGDAFFFAFGEPVDAVVAAVQGQLALHEHAWPDSAAIRVRMGVHTGEPMVTDEGYVGLDVVRAARICAAGHGGQVLVSETTRVAVAGALPAGVSLVDLGERHLKDVGYERLFQLVVEGLPSSFPPVRHHREGRAEAMALRFTDRIMDLVERELDAELDESSDGSASRRRWVRLRRRPSGEDA